MPSTCPRCRSVVAEDVICCAELRYTWRCRTCRKVSEGFAIPYGKCFLCGGALEVISGHDLEDPLKVRPIRDAVQFELNAYHFYRLARQKTSDAALRSIFQELYQHEVEHLHLLQSRYHVHLDDGALQLHPDEDTLLAEALFRGIDLTDPVQGAAGLYDKAIEMERRTLAHFRGLARTLPEGPEQEICLELAAEEEEHVALLEAERESFHPAVAGTSRHGGP
jgi:rubrerythrin